MDGVGRMGRSGVSVNDPNDVLNELREKRKGKGKKGKWKGSYPPNRHYPVVCGPLFNNTRLSPPTSPCRPSLTISYIKDIIQYFC